MVDDDREAATEATDGADTEETMRRLEARLLQASQAAERLIREAAERLDPDSAPGTHAGGKEAGAGAGTPRDRPFRPHDLEVLGELWNRIGGLVPPDLQRRLSEALRELLLALRAVIDWYLERSAPSAPEALELKDIPVL